MEASQVRYTIKDIAPKLISPDPVERNSSLNAYVADQAHLSSSWVSADGITKIKEVSEAWGSARLKGEVESVEYDKETQVATIHSKQTYTIPVLHLLKVTTHSTTKLYLNQEDDDDEEPVLLITAIEETDGVGALLKKLPIIPTVLPVFLTPLLVFIGSILLAHSHHVAQMSKLSSALPLSDPLKAVLHPIQTTKSILSILMLSSLSLVGAIVGAWQSNVGDKYTLGLDLNFGNIPPDDSSSSSSFQYASNPKKRAHTNGSEEPAASSNSPPTKQPRTEAPSAPSVPALPHEGESYAAAVKEHGADEDVHQADGHDGQNDVAPKQDVKQQDDTPVEKDAGAVKDGEGAPEEKKTEEEVEYHHDGETIAEKAKVVEGFSFADIVKE